MVKNLTKFWLLTAFMLLSIISAYGQVTIGSTTYSTLGAGFNAINAGTHTGNIVVQITSDITESSTAILQPSGVGNASYSSILIYPTGTYTIQANSSTGVVQLQGADNVTIDGRTNQSGSSQNLTFKNNSTGGPVIRIDSLISGDPANYNKVLYCNLIGSAKNNSYAVGVSMGVSNSVTASASSEGNEVGYCNLKYLYQGVRAYSTSGREVLGLKIYGNYFGSSTLTESISYQPLYIYYTKDAQIYDNTFEYIDYTSTVYVMYIYYSNGIKVNNNTVKNMAGVSSQYIIYAVSSNDIQITNNTIDNIRTSSSVVYPIYLSSCTAPKVNGNYINNINLPSTFYGIYCSGAGSYPQFNNNTVRNVVNTTTTYGIYVTSASYATINNNTIENFDVSGTSTNYGFYLSSDTYTESNNNKIQKIKSGGPFYGYYATSCTESKFQNNFIDNLTSNGSSTTAAIGFYVLSSNNSIFANNSISNLRSTRWSTSTTTNPFGFLITSGTGYKLYYNSVNLTGDQLQSGTSASLTACLMITSTAVNSLDIRNNNFRNDMTGASGTRSLAIYIPGSGTLTSTTMDYNNYYVAGTFGSIGYYNGTYHSALSAWKTAISKDDNSNNIDPVFNSSSVLAPYIGSPIVGKGTPISGYTTDILGENRSSSTPTPGAYENADDIVGPAIVYTPLLTTTSDQNRTIVANITDRTGLNTSSSAPRLYYRKQSQQNVYNDNTSSTDGWKYATPTQAGDDFTFVIDYSRINGGISLSDVIEYFIIAQDISGRQNLSVTTGSFASYPTNTSLGSANFPINGADSYRYAAAIKGDYSVGSGQTYTNLSQPNGIFKFLNENVVTGDVNIIVTSNLTETGEIALGRLTYEGGTFTVNIRTNSTTERVISGDIASGAPIRFLGANNVTIDGSVNGVGRYLAITNTSTTSPRSCINIGSNSGTGGNNITVQNCKVYCSSNAATSIGITVTDGAISTSSTANNLNNLTIRNNWIYKVNMGIIARGGTSTGQFLNNLLIENNLIGNDTDADAIYQFGIDVQNAPSGMIRRNTIWNISNTASSKWAIQLGGTTTPTGIICDGNYIYKIRYTSTGGWGAYGINIVGGNAHTMINNMISDIKTDRYSNSSTTYNPFAIRIGGGSNHRIWHNTIIMTGNQEATNSSASLTANILYLSTSYTGMDIRGNILHNSLQGIEGTRSFCILLYSHSAVGSAFSKLDHNLYSVGGSAGVVGGWGSSVPYTEGLNLATWKSMTGMDVNSREGLPVLINNDNNLHINGASLNVSSFMFGGIPEVTTDAEGEIRNNPTYYGADEVNAGIALLQDTKIAPSNPVLCVNDVSTISFDNQVQFADNISRTGISSISMQWYKNGSPISGQNGKNITFNPLKMSDSARYYATATFMGKTITTSEVLMKVETPLGLALQPTNTDVCTTTPNLALYTSPSGNIFSFQWEFRKQGTSNWLDVPNAINKDLVRLMDNPENSVGDYRLKITGPGNCGPSVIYSNIANVTLSDPLANISIAQVGTSAGKDLTHTCFGDNITLKTSVTGTIFGYRWQKNVGQGFVDLSPAQYPSAHTPTLELFNSDPNESGTYRCKILGSASCGTAERFTDEIPVRIWPYFILDQQPESRVLCVGEDSFIRVNITGVVYSYQWYLNGEKLTAKESEYFNKPVFYINKANYDHSGVYSCQVEAEDCFGKISLMSESAAVYVATGTEITNSPFTQAVVAGDNVTFRVRAHVNGVPKGIKPTVQWFKGTTPLEEGGRFVGTKSDILMIRNVQDADFGEDYRVVVTGHCGFDEARGFGIIKGMVQITEQPQGVDACQDEHIILNVRANTNIPAELTYQWFRDGIKLNDGNGLLGTSGNTLHINPANKYHSGNYYCLIKTAGSVTGLTTVDAIVNVENKAEITSQPTATLNLKPTETIALMVEAIGNDLTYQWYHNGVKIDGEQENTLVIYDIKEENAGDYYCEITNSCGVVRTNVSKVIITTTTTDVKDLAVKGGYTLGLPVPNPVTNVSSISYSVPSASRVKITIVNELGADVAVINEGIVNEGIHTIMINAEGLNLASGVYNVVLKSNDILLTQRIIVIK